MTSRCIGVGVEEAADLGVVITALQVIEPGILGGRLAILPFLSDYPWFPKRKPGVFCLAMIRLVVRVLVVEIIGDC